MTTCVMLSVAGSTSTRSRRPHHPIDDRLSPSASTARAHRKREPLQATGPPAGLCTTPAGLRLAAALIVLPWRTDSPIEAIAFHPAGQKPRIVAPPFCTGAAKRWGGETATPRRRTWRQLAQRLDRPAAPDNLTVRARFLQRPPFVGAASVHNAPSPGCDSPLRRCPSRPRSCPDPPGYTTPSPARPVPQPPCSRAPGGSAFRNLHLGLHRRTLLRLVPGAALLAVLRSFRQRESRSYTLSRVRLPSRAILGRPHCGKRSHTYPTRHTPEPPPLLQPFEVDSAPAPSLQGSRNSLAGAWFNKLRCRTSAASSKAAQPRRGTARSASANTSPITSPSRTGRLSHDQA